MKTVNAIRNSLFSLTVLTFFTACGGGTGDSVSANSTGDQTTTLTAASNTVTGQFIDGPVKGLYYECSSGKSGLTNEEGEFVCEKGDSVTFKVGSIVLGEAAAAAVITPTTLSETP